MSQENVETVRRGFEAALRGDIDEVLWDHAEALEALGLSEQDAHADS